MHNKKRTANAVLFFAEKSLAEFYPQGVCGIRKEIEIVFWNDICVPKNTLHGANVRAFGACAERSEILLKKLTLSVF